MPRPTWVAHSPRAHVQCGDGSPGQEPRVADDLRSLILCLWPSLLLVRSSYRSLPSFVLFLFLMDLFLMGFPPFFPSHLARCSWRMAERHSPVSSDDGRVTSSSGDDFPSSPSTSPPLNSFHHSPPTPHYDQSPSPDPPLSPAFDVNSGSSGHLSQSYQSPPSHFQLDPLWSPSIDPDSPWLVQSSTSREDVKSWWGNKDIRLSIPIDLLFVTARDNVRQKGFLWSHLAAGNVIMYLSSGQQELRLKGLLGVSCEPFSVFSARGGDGGSSSESFKHCKTCKGKQLTRHSCDWRRGPRNKKFGTGRNQASPLPAPFSPTSIPSTPPPSSPYSSSSSSSSSSSFPPLSPSPSSSRSVSSSSPSSPPSLSSPPRPSSFSSSSSNGPRWPLSPSPSPLPSLSSLSSLSSCPQENYFEPAHACSACVQIRLANEALELPYSSSSCLLSVPSTFSVEPSLRGQESSCTSSCSVCCDGRHDPVPPRSSSSTSSSLSPASFPTSSLSLSSSGTHRASTSSASSSASSSPPSATSLPPPSHDADDGIKAFVSLKKKRKR
jgi:hypothetical protein